MKFEFDPRLNWVIYVILLLVLVITYEEIAGRYFQLDRGPVLEDARIKMEHFQMKREKGTYLCI